MSSGPMRLFLDTSHIRLLLDVLKRTVYGELAGTIWELDPARIIFENENENAQSWPATLDHPRDRRPWKL